MKTWHKKKENRNKDNEIKKERYAKNVLTEEEHNQKREYDCFRKKKIAKIKVDKNLKNQSRVEVQGMKLKDKNRKRKHCHPELHTNIQRPVQSNSSRERVRKHRKKEVDYLFTFYYSKEH